jgi:hypothetical protein
MKIEFEVRVPISMSSIRLGDYQKYMKIAGGFKEGEDSDEFLKLKMLEIFCGVELKDSYRLPLSVFDGAIDRVVTCLNEKIPLIRRFHLTGPDGSTPVEFGFIPNLQEISYGENWDIEGNINNIETLHKAMAVLFRPIVKTKGEAYDIREYSGHEATEELMKDMPLDVALGALVFFYRLGMKLSRYTSLSSLKQLSKDPNKLLDLEKRLLEQSGVGISRFMRLLEETSSSLMRLPESHFTNV